MISLSYLCLSCLGCFHRVLGVPVGPPSHAHMPRFLALGQVEVNQAGLRWCLDGLRARMPVRENLACNILGPGLSIFSLSR